MTVFVDGDINLTQHKIDAYRASSHLKWLTGILLLQLYYWQHKRWLRCFIVDPFQLWHFLYICLCQPSSSSSSNLSSRQRCSHWPAVEVWQCLQQAPQQTQRSASWSSSSWFCCFMHTSASDGSRPTGKWGPALCLTAAPWRTSWITWPTARLASPARVSWRIWNNRIMKPDW